MKRLLYRFLSSMALFAVIMVLPLIATTHTAASETGSGTTATLSVRVVDPPTAPCAGDTPYPFYRVAVNSDGQLSDAFWGCSPFIVDNVFPGEVQLCSDRRTPIGQVVVNYGCADPSILDQGPHGYCPVGVTGNNCQLWQYQILRSSTFLLPSTNDSDRCPLGYSPEVVVDHQTNVSGVICSP